MTGTTRSISSWMDTGLENGRGGFAADVQNMGTLVGQADALGHGCVMVIEPTSV